ncbi:MAG: TetR/AcrR family transcriptional regulator [Desulfomonilaceae bacterium]
MTDNTRKKKQLEKIVESAIRVFSARGYRQAQMSQIAREAGIAPGTLYLYFEGKESLFNFLLRYIFSNEQDLDAISVPIESTSWDFGIASGKDTFVSSKYTAFIDNAVRKGEVTDVHEEFEKIIRNLFSAMATYRHGITILLQSSLDWPELADFYVSIIKDLHKTVEVYLDKRIHQGLFRKIPNVSASARFILDTIAWFAVHRHRAMYQTVVSEKVAEETVVDALVHAFIPQHLHHLRGAEA